MSVSKHYVDPDFTQVGITDTAPTVGRVVWYWQHQGMDDNFVSFDEQQPFRADVLFVHPRPANCVNLMVTDHAGNRAFRGQVPLFDLPKWDDDGNEFTTSAEAVDYLDFTIDSDRGIATWMPYQTKQHAQQALDTAAATLMAGETQESLMPEYRSQSPETGVEYGLILTDGKDV